MSDLVKSHVPMGQTFTTADQMPAVFALDGGTVTASPVVGYTPTMQLRWFNGVLQQAWEKRVYLDNKEQFPEVEWRDVPQEDPAEARIIAEDDQSVTVYVPAAADEPMFEDKDGNPIYEHDERLRCINQTGFDPAIDDDNGGFL